MAVDLNAFPGYQGWGQTEAEADFKATGGQGKGPSGGGGGGTRTESIDPSQIPSSLEFVQQQEAPITEAFKEYAMQVRGQKAPLDVYSELEQAAGLPQQKKVAATLREQIGSLEDTIRRVEPQVQATTKESLVTQGQQEGMIAERRKPLMEILERLGTGLGRVTQGISAGMADIGTKAGLVFRGQEQQLEPLKMKLSLLQDRSARLISGFNQDASNKLQILMTNFARSNQLADRDVEQAFTLLQQESSYKRELEKLQKQSELELSQYAAKQPIDLATYEKQKQIDLKYKPVSGTAGTEKYYNQPTNYYGNEWEYAG